MSIKYDDLTNHLLLKAIDGGTDPGQGEDRGPREQLGGDVPQPHPIRGKTPL